ncbi:DUF2628 domain-containing protein [uncultured Fusobacterium sp.]|jgi:hypothetical protein|uniref:DUF2628 domain-containing protein n=1 Tax=uncultured Fusobacterium sp. TaxID=159267 RepID=UPI0015A66B7E|nr:DUF2628 domain-containing protein [uncultured Fusobacterium sp.]
MERNLYKNPEILKAYIGTPSKFSWYEKVFDSYDVNGVEKFSFNWSWWAFLGGPAYLAYRKCYLMVAGVWLVQILLSYFFTAWILFSIVLGFICPWLVYKKYRKTIAEIENAENDFAIQVEMARELGGVNTLVRNIIVALYGVILILFFTAIGLMTILV